MSRAFDAHGGMLTAEELVQSMRTNVVQPLSIVALLDRQPRGRALHGRSRTCFPCFQFARNPMSILPAVSVIILELRDAYDDWARGRFCFVMKPYRSTTHRRRGNPLRRRCRGARRTDR